MELLNDRTLRERFISLKTLSKMDVFGLDVQKQNYY